MQTIFTKLKQNISYWLANVQTIEIGELHDQLNPINVQINDYNGELKFVQQSFPKQVYVETPSRFFISKTFIKNYSLSNLGNKITRWKFLKSCRYSYSNR